MATNVPVTIWRPTDGNSEFVSGSSNNIVDSSVNFLVDSSSNFIVDSGGSFVMKPTTVWSEDDGQ